MDSDYIQALRYKLQKRLKRLNTASFQNFHWTLHRSWGFLQENEITKGILDDLERRFPGAEQYADRIIAGQFQFGKTESESDAISYWTIKKCACVQETKIEVKVGRQLLSLHTEADAIEAFKLSYVEPLFDYIDEHIDDNVLYSLCSGSLNIDASGSGVPKMSQKYRDKTRTGEKALARELYQYLHDQGLQFQVEPESASGRIDLISAQSGRDRLVADVKLFNPERRQDCGYIIEGFRQIYDYTKDFNESFGYLVIFKTCEQDLALPTLHQESCIPFITHNNKTIFLLVIDIFDYPEPASKRGKLKTLEITPSIL